METKLIRNCKDKFSELVMTEEKQALERKLLLKKKNLFTIKQPFQRKWYDSNDRKFLKTKLGTLNECSMGVKNKLVVRELNFDMKSPYQVDAYIETLVRLRLYKLDPYILFPEAIHISKELDVSVITEQHKTLYELVHEPSTQPLTLLDKVEIMI